MWRGEELREERRAFGRSDLSIRSEGFCCLVCQHGRFCFPTLPDVSRISVVEQTAQAELHHRSVIFSRVPHVVGQLSVEDVAVRNGHRHTRLDELLFAERSSGD